MSGNSSDLFLCNNILDCLEIGDGITIIRDCVKLDDNEEGVCDCSTYYGWRGDNCDQPSATLYFWWCFRVLYSLTFFLLTLYGGSLLFLFIKVQFFGKHVRKSINPIFYVIIAAFIASILIFSSSVLTLYSIFDSNAFILTIEKSLLISEEELIIQANYENIVQILYATGTCFQIFASLLIILSWFDVLIKITNIFPQEDFWSEKKIRNIIILVILFALPVELTLAIKDYGSDLLLIFLVLS